MQPVSPVVPGKNLPEVIYAKNQPQYRQLPVFKQEDGLTLSRWRLTWKERIKVLFSGNIYLTLLTFNHPLQPVKLQVEEPEFNN